MNLERDLKPFNGYVMLFVFFILFIGSIAVFAILENAWFLAIAFSLFLYSPGSSW